MKRLDGNPLLTPDDVRPTRDDVTVLCTLNPAAVRFGDEILLLVRVGEAPRREDGWVSYLYYDADRQRQTIGRIDARDPDLAPRDGRTFFYRGKLLLTSLSHLRIARSTGGRSFTFDPAPAILPTTPYESYGCEDARITEIDGTYWIAYTAVSARGVTVALASTRDFATFEKHGVIFPPHNKDVCLFPEKIRGRYVCRHRPYESTFNEACIWTAYSPDLRAWGHHEMTLAPTSGTWEGGRVGAGAPPIRTSEGWLEVYHAADATGRYGLGAMLSDLEHPERVIRRSRRPILEPTADYEMRGVHDQVVFSNGWVVGGDGTVTIYYGAGDRCCCAAVTGVDELLAAARK